MFFKTFSAAVFGIDAYLVETEVDVVPAFEGHFTVVGLPDIAVKESRERIRAALRNCGFDFPSGHAVTINLAPADIRKEGSACDLPMALGLAGCQGSFFGKILDTGVFLGELSLDGGVRSVRGALSAARERGIKNVVVPEASGAKPPSSKAFASSVTRRVSKIEQITVSGSFAPEPQLSNEDTK
jgi:magnesium chelatase family protein